MDTDDLSKETYDAIIIASDRFHHDLSLQFGVLSGDCKSEEEYLIATENMIKGWMKDSGLDEAIDDIFFDIPPEIKNFKRQLEKLLENISNVKQIPIKNRNFENW